jgi:hypothetical protein
MNLGVAVQASPGKHAVLARSGRSLESLKFRVDSTRMLGPIVAGLTELRYFALQEFGMIAAVGGVAAQAVLLHRGMFPHVRASFLCMTLVAQVIERTGLDHPGPEPAMVVMAVRAFQLPFPDGMM